MGGDTVSRQREGDISDSSSLEKEDVYQIENGMSEEKRMYLAKGLTSDDADFLLSLTTKQKNAIYRKVDIRLVPMLALLYEVPVH